MSDYSQPVASSPVPAPQAGGAYIFSKRGLLAGLGIALVALAAVNYLFGVLNYFQVVSFYSDSTVFSLPAFLGYLNPVLLFLIAAVLATSGIVMVLEGFRMRRFTIPRQWCVMNGVADIALACAAFFGIIASILSLNYGMLLEITDYDFELIAVVMELFDFPGYILCAGAAALYFVSGINQKKVGKVNILLLIAAGLLVLYPFMQIILLVAGNFLPPIPLYTLNLVAGTLLFLGRSARGLAFIAYPRTIASPIAPAVPVGTMSVPPGQQPLSTQPPQ